MFHEGVRQSGGDLPEKQQQKINSLFVEFARIIKGEIKEVSLRTAMVRAMLPCSIVVALDCERIWVIAQKNLGMPATIMKDVRKFRFADQQIYDVGRWEFGFDDHFVLSFPIIVLDQDTSVREPTVRAIARSYIQAEIQKVQREMNVIQINPIFGQACYALDPRLAFVLMPFDDDLTEIYNKLVKPIVESPEFGLVCKRADDIKSNRAILQDIWKMICEARLVLADLTRLNANVMYDLGIAHTLGKETILIFQRGADIKFPFDLAHIRRIEYTNALGGPGLERDLRGTLSSVLTPTLHV